MSSEHITDTVSRSEKFPTKDYTHVEAVKEVTASLRRDYDIDYIEKVDVSRDGTGEHYYVSVTGGTNEGSA